MSLTNAQEVISKFFSNCLRVGHLTSNKLLDFDADPDYNPDPGMF